MAIALTRLIDLASPGRRLRGPTGVLAPGWSGAETESARSADTRALAEKVRLLAAGVSAAGFNLLNGLVVTALFWSSYPRELLLPWIATTAMAVVVRVVLFRCHKADASFRPLFWARGFAWGAALSGSCWGALALLSLVTGSMVEHVFVAFVIAGTTAGGLATLAPYLPAYLAYLGLSVGPLALAFLSKPDPIYLGMGVLSILYMVVMTMTVINCERTLLGKSCRCKLLRLDKV